MELRLANGVVLTGPAHELAAVAKALGAPLEGDGLHYNSSSRGLVRISEMSTQHIKNALRKRYRAWVDAMDTNVSASEFAAMLHTGPRSDVTLLGLVAELKKRV